MIPDLLAESASDRMREIWSPEWGVVLERQLWIRVMVEQAQMGLVIPTSAIEASAKVLAQGEYAVDLESIRQRELVTKHDLKARLEEFCELAGHEYHHLGMTSADVVDNCMLIKMRWTLQHLARVDPRFDRLVETIPFRGIKGPVGTQQDQLDLLGTEELCDMLDQRVARTWGFQNVINSCGQVYHRSIDFQWTSEIAGLLQKSHKSPLLALLSGFVAMMAVAGADTWNEGDVSQSATRRVALPGTAYVASILLEQGGELVGP